MELRISHLELCVPKHVARALKWGKRKSIKGWFILPDMPTPEALFEGLYVGPFRTADNAVACLHDPEFDFIEAINEIRAECELPLPPSPPSQEA